MAEQTSTPRSSDISLSARDVSAAIGKLLAGLAILFGLAGWAYEFNVVINSFKAPAPGTAASQPARSDILSVVMPMGGKRTSAIVREEPAVPVLPRNSERPGKKLNEPEVNGLIVDHSRRVRELRGRLNAQSARQNGNGHVAPNGHIGMPRRIMPANKV